MPCDCGAVGLEEIFGDRTARHEAKRFRKKGLTPRSKKLLDAVEREIPLAGATSLEVGAGIGAATITMLKRGVARSRIVDAVPAYIAVAEQLAAESGVADSLDLELGDYVERAAQLPSFDIILMDRVVCCYPVRQDLLAPAAAQAVRVIALTYPRGTWWSRMGVAAINLTSRARRLAFRVHVHPPQEMQGLLRERGYRTRVAGHHGVWEIMVATRAPAV